MIAFYKDPFVLISIRIIKEQDDWNVYELYENKTILKKTLPTFPKHPTPNDFNMVIFCILKKYNCIYIPKSIINSPDMQCVIWYKYPPYLESKKNEQA